MSKRKFKELSPLRDVIKAIFQQSSMQKMSTIKMLAERWKNIVDIKMRDHTDVRDKKDGILYVDVDNPLWSMELKFQEQDLISRMNEKCGKGMIHSIVYRTRTLQRNKTGQSARSPDNE